MKKKIFLTTVFFFFCFLFSLQNVFAVDSSLFSVIISPTQVFTNTKELEVTVTANSDTKFRSDDDFTLRLVKEGEKPDASSCQIVNMTLVFVRPVSETKVTATFKIREQHNDTCVTNRPGDWRLWMWRGRMGTSPTLDKTLNQGGNVYVADYPFIIYKIGQELRNESIPDIEPWIYSIQRGHPEFLTVRLINGVKESTYAVVWDYNILKGLEHMLFFKPENDGENIIDLQSISSEVADQSGNHVLCIRKTTRLFANQAFALLGCQDTANYLITDTDTTQPTPTPLPPVPEECRIMQEKLYYSIKFICEHYQQCYETMSECTAPDIQQPADIPVQLKKICDNVPDNEKDNCIACTAGVSSGTARAKYSGKIGSYTAIGCLPTDLSTFFSDYLWPYGLGIAGGIAFLLMLWGAFNILVSMGDPKRIEHGRELIVSAITGLLFIIFAVLILRIIGVDTLKIPGFS